MTTYTITVTENQARLIAQAMDLVSRIQMGQWYEFIDWLPSPPAKAIATSYV